MSSTDTHAPTGASASNVSDDVVPDYADCAALERVVVIPGFGAAPEDHWFPWLAGVVPGAEVVRFPDLGSPQADRWVPLAAEVIGSLDARTAVVTHSLGGVTALRAVEALSAPGAVTGEERGQYPHIGVFVAVAPFARPLPVVTTMGDELARFLGSGLGEFLSGGDPAALRPHLGRTEVICSDNDPVVPPRYSQAFATEVGAPVVTVPGAGHFLASDGVTALPQVVEALQRASRSC